MKVKVKINLIFGKMKEKKLTMWWKLKEKIKCNFGKWNY